MSGRLPQITCRPGSFLLDEIDLIVDQTKLSRAEVVRQLTVEGLNQYREGRLVFAQSGDLRKTRTCGQKISAKRRGRTYKIMEMKMSQPAPLTPPWSVSND